MCAAPPAQTFARTAGEGVNAVEWGRVGAASPLPCLPEFLREFLSCLWVSVESCLPPKRRSELGIVDSL